MTRMIAMTLAATLLLGGCNGAGEGKGGKDASAAAIKREPGSWQQKIELIKLAGPDVKPGDKEKMQQMFAMMGGMSMCLTPEAAAKEDAITDVSSMRRGGADCKVEKRDVSGNKVDVAVTCKSAKGETMKMAGHGTVAATSREMTVSQTLTNADGSPAGEMVMHITGTRKGACTPSDVTPPSPPEPAA